MPCLACSACIPLVGETFSTNNYQNFVGNTGYRFARKFRALIDNVEVHRLGFAPSQSGPYRLRLLRETPFTVEANVVVNAVASATEWTWVDIPTVLLEAGEMYAVIVGSEGNDGAGYLDLLPEAPSADPNVERVGPTWYCGGGCTEWPSYIFSVDFHVDVCTKSKWLWCFYGVCVCVC